MGDDQGERPAQPAADQTDGQRQVTAACVGRGEQGRSLSELARASGIAKATLSALEAGRGNPTIETLSSLATALGVPFGDLLAGGAPEPVHVVHAAEGTTVPGTANTLRLIVRLPGNPPIELYEARFPPPTRP